MFKMLHVCLFEALSYFLLFKCQLPLLLIIVFRIATRDDIYFNEPHGNFHTILDIARILALQKKQKKSHVFVLMFRFFISFFHD